MFSMYNEIDICPNHQLLEQYYKDMAIQQQSYLESLCEFVDIVKSLYLLEGKIAEPYKYFAADKKEDDQKFAFERIALYFLNREMKLKQDHLNTQFKK